MTLRLAYTLAACCLAILPALAQAPGLANVNTQLRAQETKDSQLMWWLHEVTDVYGPRLTGSPGLRAAQDFAVGQMVKWGFSNVHLEAWNFNHPGWQNWDLEANAVSPFQQPLNVRAVSWTPGTNGPVQGPVLVVEPPQPPAAAGRGGRGGGGFGGARRRHDARAVGGHREPRHRAAAHAGGDAEREEARDPGRPRCLPGDDQRQGSRRHHLLRPARAGGGELRAGAVAPCRRFLVAARRRRGGGVRAAAVAVAGGAAPEGLTAAEIAQQVNKFLIENGALVKVTDAGRAYGVIVQQSTAGYNENPNNPNLPSLLMGNEDYGRIYRTSTIDHIPVVLRINIHNEFYPSRAHRLQRGG